MTSIKYSPSAARSLYRRFFRLAIAIQQKSITKYTATTRKDANLHCPTLFPILQQLSAKAHIYLYSQTPFSQFFKDIKFDPIINGYTASEIKIETTYEHKDSTTTQTRHTSSNSHHTSSTRYNAVYGYPKMPGESNFDSYAISRALITLIRWIFRRKPTETTIIPAPLLTLGMSQPFYNIRYHLSTKKTDNTPHYIHKNVRVEIIRPNTESNGSSNDDNILLFETISNRYYDIPNQYSIFPISQADEADISFPDSTKTLNYLEFIQYKYNIIEEIRKYASHVQKTLQKGSSSDFPSGKSTKSKMKTSSSSPTKNKKTQKLDSQTQLQPQPQTQTSYSKYSSSFLLLLSANPVRYVQDVVDIQQVHVPSLLNLTTVFRKTYRQLLQPPIDLQNSHAHSHSRSHSHLQQQNLQHQKLQKDFQRDEILELEHRLNIGLRTLYMLEAALGLHPTILVSPLPETSSQNCDVNNDMKTDMCKTLYSLSSQEIIQQKYQHINPEIDILLQKIVELTQQCVESDEIISNSNVDSNLNSDPKSELHQVIHKLSKYIQIKNENTVISSFFGRFHDIIASPYTQTKIVSPFVLNTVYGNMHKNVQHTESTPSHGSTTAQPTATQPTTGYTNDTTGYSISYSSHTPVYTALQPTIHEINNTLNLNILPIEDYLHSNFVYTSKMTPSMIHTSIPTWLKTVSVQQMYNNNKKKRTR